MELKYILSPIQLGKHTLKSRLIHTTSYTMNLGMPGHQITSAEMFAQAERYYLAVANAGAALVNFSGGSFPDRDGNRSEMMSVQYDDPEIRSGFQQLIEKLHQVNTLSVSNLRLEPDEYNISWLNNWDEMPIIGDYAPHFVNKPTCPQERLEQVIEDYAIQCKGLKDIGFDGVNFHMSYHSSYMCTALSPVLNQRTDKYGGKTLAQRARFPLEVLSRVREACGPDFIIEIQMSAHEETPGYTVEDWLEFCKLAEGLFDIVQIRGFDGSYTHVTGFNSTKAAPHTLQFAEQFKARGIRGLTAPVGGFNDPIDIDRFISEGKTDLVAMARTWLADQDYAEKIRRGHPEDVTPCLGCMGKCDYPSCAVNPRHGLIRNPELFAGKGSSGQRVAVIGGGPAGLRAALTAAELGHHVVLFEKTEALGGQLKFAQYPDFAWKIDEYRKWLLRQIEKSPVDVRLNTEATPELLQQENYDAIICALGSSPKLPPIPGADLVSAWNVDNVWAHEKELGKRVVVVGGGASAREAALYLARQGHQVTMLTRDQEIYTDNCHCIWGEMEQYVREPNLTVLNFATTKEIADNHVVCRIEDRPLKPMTYFYVRDRLDAAQKKHTTPVSGLSYPQYPKEEMFFIPPEAAQKPEASEAYPARDETIDFDSIVLSGGRATPDQALAAFRGLAPKLFVVGDAAVPASIQEATLTAFAAAMEI